jgi:Gluconate 2-dehydrogenase subunit 3
MLDTAQRQTLAGLADVLIPASDPMPSATTAGVPDVLIDQVLGYRPDLAEPFAAALANCAGQDPEAALDALAANHPAQFEALTLLTSGAYFLSTLVNQALAYDGPPQTVRDDIDTYVDLLSTVAERGFTSR